ncbi:hypothetical protein EV356DRAFT_508657 [Viridothelium virens]|uniref:SMP domain-containing protein n=1 Tax=Viridothelium virens TaxID=1048519 RepID=A0A6A6HJP7_VIRVR|nr:hypothetical protein EV356DRAFT_508657 [Viridothelium virens]
MSGTDETFHYTKEDVRRLEQKESARHGGNIPKNSETAGLQSVVDQADKDKDQIISERQANLPLPDQPPTSSDFSSADARTVNVDSGGVQDDFSYGGGSSSIREPATGDSDVRASGEDWKTNTAGSEVGRTAKDNLGGIPSDAVTREARNKTGTVETRQPDYGYPQKNDPSNSNA